MFSFYLLFVFYYSLTQQKNACILYEVSLFPSHKTQALSSYFENLTFFLMIEYLTAPMIYFVISIKIIAPKANPIEIAT